MEGPPSTIVDSLSDDQLLKLLHRNKTKISCIEKPKIFLHCLRDHGLVTKEECERVLLMTDQTDMSEGISDVLDRVEKQPSDIQGFWKCVFQGFIMDRYPAIKEVYQSLSNDMSEGKSSSENGKRQRNPEKNRKRKEDQPGPSSQVTPRKKAKAMKAPDASTLKKNEKENIWRRRRLPVTCGEKNGLLIKPKLAKGEPCIKVGSQWFTPTEFEKFASMEGSGNWKRNIQCEGTPLARLIKMGFLKVGSMKRTRS